MLERKPPGGDSVICPGCHGRNSNDAKVCTICSKDLKTNQNPAATGSASKSPSSNSTDGNSTTTNGNPCVNGGKSPSTTSVTDGTSPSSYDDQIPKSDIVHTKVTKGMETTFGSDKSCSDLREMVGTDDFSNNANDSAGSKSVTSGSDVSKKFVSAVAQSDLANKGTELPNPSHVSLSKPNEVPPRTLLVDNELNQNSSPQKNESNEVDHSVNDSKGTAPYDNSLLTEKSCQSEMDLKEQSHQTQNNQNDSVPEHTNAPDNVEREKVFGTSAAKSYAEATSVGIVASRATLFENDSTASGADKTPMKPSTNNNNMNKKDVVTFDFVVVLPPHIELGKDDALFIVFDHHSLGNWHPQLQFKLRFISSFIATNGSFYHIYSQTAEIDRSFVTRFRKVEYKYVIVRPNYATYWEFLHGEEHKDIAANRKLCDVKGERIVRFDGCFEPEFKEKNRGIFGRAFGFLFGSDHDSKISEIVGIDHKLALKNLLPTFDKSRGFMEFDYSGVQTIRPLNADVAVRKIRKMAIGFKRRTAEWDFFEVLANYFSGILHTASLPNVDPIIRFTGTLVFIRCYSLLDCRTLADPIVARMKDQQSLHNLCSLLSLAPNIDRSELLNLASSIDDVRTENSRSKNLPEAILKWMESVGLQALCAVPFYHLLTKTPNYWSVSTFNCVNDAWWKSALLRSYLLSNGTVDRDALKNVFYQIHSSLTGPERPAFVRTVLFVYCDEPKHVIQLQLTQHDPILVAAWIALHCNMPKYNKRTSNLQKYTDQYMVLFDHLMRLLKNPVIEYKREHIHAFLDILITLLEVIDDNINFLSTNNQYLSPYLLTNIALMLDASVILLSGYYAKDDLKTLKNSLELSLKKTFRQLFPIGRSVEREFQIMIELGQVKMEELGEIWVSVVCNLFRSRRELYLKMDAAQVLQWYCDCNQELVADDFQKMLGTFIENLIEENADYLLNYKNTASIGPEAKGKLRIAVTNIFKKQWPKDCSDSAVVDHMLNWALIDIIISRSEGDFQLLSHEAVDKLNIGCTLVSSTWEACINGNITLKNAAKLWGKRDRFVSLISKIHKTVQYEAIYSTLEQLQSVLHKFTALMKNIKALQFLLQSKEEKVSYLDVSASQQLDQILANDTELEISKLASRQSSTNGTVEWRFDSPLPLELDQTLTMIRDKKLSTSRLFNALLKEKLAGHSLMSFNSLHSLIIKPTIEQLKDTVKIILNGQILLKDVLQLVNILPPDHIHSSFQTEILSLCNELNIGDANEVRHRITQMCRFLDLRQKSFNCTILNKMLQKVKLVKCQQEIRVFVEMCSNMEEKTLGEMTENLNHIASVLETIIGNRGDCLKTVLANWDFIQWIRVVAGKTEKQLQNFVSIASTNVGESEIEIAMMSDFGKAVTGFSTLIYGIHEIADKEAMRLTQFLDEFLEPVWQALKEDSKLPAKLSASAKNSDRIKCLYEATGSLEKHSITKAEEINKVAIFIVGCLDKSIIFGNPDDCVKMMLKNESWSMKDLRDLRSKLMLIGVQMDEHTQSRIDIDNFTKLFDAVAGLASLYVGHCKAGNVLLSQLHCTFNCDQQVSYQLMAKLQDQPPCFESKCTEQMNLVDQIGDISRFLEESLKSWKAHLSDTRQDFPELNYFTSQQLVYLRRQVVQVRKEQSLDPSTAFRLMSLQPDVNAKMVLSALDKSVTDMGNEDNSESHTADQPGEELRYFVDQLIEMGVEDEGVALKAITAKGTDDLELALEWALNYMDDETKKDEMMKEIPSFMEKLSQLTEQLELCPETEPLAVQLQRVWLKYLEVHETRYRELMGLRQLGYLLRNLTSTTALPCVPCPAVIKPNVPNLAILPEIDIPRCVLSLFAQTDFKGLTYENVLVCSERTTAEELHLFLLRIQKPIERAADCRLFAIVSIDRLSSEVCQAVEADLNKDLRSAKSFGLVLICAEESSDRCHLAGVLSRYQLKVKDAMVKVSKIRSCVHKLLQRRENAGLLESDLLPLYYNGYLCTSIGYGHGKSEAVRKQLSVLPLNTTVLKIPVHTRCLDLDVMFSSLKKQGLVDPSKSPRRLIHLDILDHRIRRVDMFLFQLLILGGFVDSSGNVWRKLPNDCYAIEMTSVANELLGPTDLPAHEFRFLLPVTQCHSPAMTKHYSDHPDLIKKDCPYILYKLLDAQFMQDERVQRCCAYLQKQNEDLTTFLFVPDQPKVSNKMLDILLENCGVKNPSWTELFHFIKFLNTQLLYCERSNYFLPQIARDLPGIKNFVVKFLIQMSKDFATRSLVISEDVSQLTKGQEAFEELDQYGLKQQWESEPHPYLFFNADASTISLFGCNFRRGHNAVDLTDSSEKKIIRKGISTRLLYDALITQTRNDRYANDFECPFEKKNQQEKLLKLCRVLGLPDPRMPSDKPDAVGPFTENPDPSYEITTDCALKMLAIEMRFRCGIPVVIMGETGCGKTRLIRYLCYLKKGGKNVENLIILRVHGGITADKIRAVVLKAIDVSKTNWHLHKVNTCLFFDEANTTTAISQIKEIVCDHTMDGENLDFANLDIIAAVNPYRRHSDEVIQKLEGAGLGYHVQDINNVEKFGDIPMRRLVYRVQPLPPSMIPFVWDFGRLTVETERIYITQMVNKFVSRIFLNDDVGNLKNVMVNVLTKIQQFMQKEQNESAFVSLRDVERSLIVMEWFWRHQDLLFREMDRKMDELAEKINPVTRSLVLALCVCYRPSLQKKRGDFDKLVTSCLKDQYALPDSSTVAKELAACQTVFIENVELEDNIAKNEALKENLFMMVMCIELRIPLFLVGKPGSSKSLAKTIVDSSMQGVNSPYTFFKLLKQAKLISYQCSPLASADGIEAIFRQCAREQQDVDLKKVVSVAVFDEIGLAEDSPKMPLKALHGLLEEGCVVKNEVLTDRHKPAFVGISNWALDPAKMNRGIFVNRVLPDKNELLRTAKHICRKGERIYDLVGHLLEPLTDSYLQLYKEQDKDYEFFGLRDFYSLVKMIFDIAMKQHRQPSFYETMHAVTRNFSGTKGKKLSLKFHSRLERMNLFPDTDIGDNDLVIDLIAENLDGLPNKERDNRFLLILTENYAAMRSLENLHQLYDKGDSNTPPALTIFGSSFPQDLEYTQICRNINKIKICMDTGRPIILLNLDTLYESLYDLLNQAFMMYSDERYVEMGLGNHRLKCHVNAKFRLIVVAEAEEVRRCFPSALINRLEKHYMSVRTDLKSGDRKLADDLKYWAIQYTNACTKEKSSDPTDMFVGYNDDTPAVLVSDVLQLHPSSRPSDEDVLKFAKQKLLQCAIPESIYRYRENCEDGIDGDWVYKTYLNEQPHNCLVQFLEHWQKQSWIMENKFMFQLTTHASSVLSRSENIITLEEMAKAMGLNDSSDVHILTLQDYLTEQQFGLALSTVAQLADQHNQLLIVQCMAADSEQNYKLVACARYLIQEKIKECSGRLFVIQLLFLQRQPLCLSDMLHRWLNEGVEKINQIATHHKLVTEEDGLALAQKCGISIKPESVEVVIDRDHNLTKSLERCIDRASAPENGIQLLIVQFSASERRQPSRLAAECRAEISRKLTNRNSERVRVLLLISLPRIASFPGPNWDSFHLDDLVLESGDLIDIGAIHDRPISQIISDPNLIDTQTLIKECVCQAASKIQDDTSRKFERIKLLEEMLEKNVGFSDVLTRNLLAVLEENENRIDNNPTEWLTKEAANSTRILERRTFRRALRNRIETDIENILCKMLCLIDVAQNLDLVMSPGFGYLWLQLFDDKSFVSQFNYQELMFSKNEDHLKMQTTTSPCHYPFSWLLKYHLDGLITTMDHLTDSHTDVERAESLSHQLNSTSWGSNVLAMSKMESMTAYIEDFVNYTVTCRPAKASELIMEWIVRLASQAMKDTNIMWPIAVHLVYQKIQDAIKRFVDLLELDQHLFDLLSDRERELEVCQFELDICVASLLVRHLTDLTKKLDSKDDLTEVTSKRLFEARSRWIMHLNVFSPVINRLFNDQLSHSDNRARLRNNKIGELSDNWKTLEICALFLKHTMSVSYSFKVAPIYEMINKTKDIGTEEFLKKFEVRSKAYNTFAFRHCFGVQCKIECAACQQFTCEPVSILPCGHLIHKVCCEDLDREVCPAPTCQKPLPKGFILVPEPEKWQSFMRCRTAVTTFFVDLVSREIFADKGPPSLEVTQKLMQYVTGKKTKGDNTTATLTPFSDLLGVDPSPVIRSYILQQLLKYNVGVVLEHIDAFVRNYDQYLQSESEKLDFLLICIGCVEDTLCADFAGLSPEAYCRRLRRLLREIKAQKELPTEIQKISVQQVAHMRCCLNIAASLLPFINSNMKNDDARACHHTLSIYVKDCGNFGRNYLIKCIGRLHGIDYLRLLMRSNKFNWLNPGLNLTDSETVADAYLVYGQNYFELRQSITQGLLNVDQTLPQTIADETIHDGHASSYLTLCLLPVLSQFDLANEPRATLLGRICTSIQNRELRAIVDQVVNLNNPLLTQLRASTNNEMLTRLVYHAQVAFSSTTGSLFKFFNLLVSNPASLMNSYFPTMWEDITAEQWKQMRNTNERTTLNYCPNNHPYFIGDCGAPNQAGHCHCGAPIGSRNGAHTRAVRNSVAQNVIDQTKMGHCLGEAASLGNQLPVERKLVPLETVLIRAIMHCAMLTADVTNKPVYTVITKGLRGANQTNQFVCEHLQKDLADLRRILKRGLDECSYLIHAVLARISFNGHAQFGDQLLTTRAARANWENEFSRVCLKPVYSDFDRILTQLRQSIANDSGKFSTCSAWLTQSMISNLDNDPLWQLVYEDDLKQPNADDLSQLFHYRAPHTTERLIDLAQEQINRSANQEHLVVLHDFIEQLNHLSAVRYLPSVIRLHSFIRSEFHGSIDLAVAKDQTIAQFIKSNEYNPEARDLKLWIDDFFAAWRLVRDLVKNEQFALPDPHKNIVSYRITDELIPDPHEPYSNPLLALVPVPCEMGLGSCALILSLIRLQNDFVISHKTQIGLPDDLETVLLKHAFAGGQILTFEIEHDVLPMLLMNRSFEFTVRSRTTAAVFDLFALQGQLITNLLSQLVLLDSMMPLMKTKHNVLLECRQKLQLNIPQKELSEYQLREIEANLHGDGDHCVHDMNRVKQCLDSAELMLRFASSGCPVEDFSMCLSDFLSEKLHKKPEKEIDQLFCNYDISELNAVWSTLLFLNNLLVLVNDETHLFPNIPKVLKQPLSPTITRSLLESLKKRDQLRFLSHLTTFITLYSDEIIGNVTEEALKTKLDGGLEEMFMVYEFEDEQKFDLPDAIKLKHTVTCWRIAAEAFRGNQNM